MSSQQLSRANNQIVEVAYEAPVICVVDLDTGKVVRVRIADEGVQGPAGVQAVDRTSVADRIADEARRIAESETWPAWEVG